MILEGVVTTRNFDQSLNVSPMGPRFADASSFQQFCLRPFQTSRTYKNLKRHGEGVLHVTDDVMLIAKAAIGCLHPLPRTQPANAILGEILVDACRWYAFQVSRLDDTDERTTIECRVVDQGRLRDFFGFNRAKHGVVEAAILATRIGILPDAEIREGMIRSKDLVEKTGGSVEHAAFDLLSGYVHRALEKKGSEARR